MNNKIFIYGGIILGGATLFIIFRQTRSDTKPLALGKMIKDPTTVKSVLEKFGITNKFLQAGVLGVLEKESGSKPSTENSYKNTSAKRIRQVFGKRFSNFNDTQIDELKKDDIKFFDFVYGGRMGNVKGTKDGFNFRGRGYNQITGHDNYKIIGQKLGLDLLNKPDLLNDPEIAVQGMAYYFGLSIPVILSKLNIASKDINTIALGVEIPIRANAGSNTKFEEPIIQEGYKKALNYAKNYV